MSIPVEQKWQLEISNRQILSIALPIAAATLVPQINFVVNNIFLGGLGELPLAVAGITGVYYLIFAVIGHGLNNGLQALMSRRAGENRPQEIGNLFAQGSLLAVALALAFIAFNYLLTPTLLRLTLTHEETYNLAVDFLLIRIWGLPFLYLFQMRNALLVATNRSKYLIVGTVLETIANIFLDYGLIYGKFGLPQLGFNGAAIASVIAEFTGLITVSYILKYKGILLSINYSMQFRFVWKHIYLIFTQSAPLMLQYGISIVTWQYFYILIEHRGTLDLAVSNTMRNVLGILGSFSWAFAATSNTMVGNIIGQNRKTEVLPLVWKIVKLSLVFAVPLSILINLFPHAFMAMFQQDEAFTIYATPVLRVISLALILQSVGTAWLNSIVGTGNAKVNVIIEVITIVLYIIYVTLALQVLHLPLIWAWASELLYWAVTLVLAYWYMRSRRWEKTVI